jgi:hypothetical protein
MDLRGRRQPTCHRRGHLLAGGRCLTSTRGAHAMQSITSADVPVALKDDNVEVRIAEVGR